MSEASEQSPLRDRLLALRADLIERLTEADIIEPAWLAVLADAETVLGALDREGFPAGNGAVLGTPMTHIRALLAEVRSGNAAAAEELADLVQRVLAHPDRRVGAALAPKPRGGRTLSQAGRLQQRDEALRQLTDLQPGTRQSARIQKAREKLDRYAANGWPHERDKPEDTGNRERDLMRQIMRTGLPVPGERQHRKIVSARSKK